jgi:hypothetical protein
MSITPKKISILNALKTQLENNIAGTGDYFYNIKSAYRREKSVLQEQKPELPYLNIIPVTSTYLPMTAEEYTTGNSIDNIQSGFIVDIYGYISAVNDIEYAGSLQDAMMQLECDIIRAVFSDYTIGSTALTIGLIETVMSYSPDDTIGEVLIRIAIKYDFYPKTNP